MALINCVECGKQMSDQAAACPHCGHPNPTFAEPEAAPETADEQRARISGKSKTDADKKTATNNGCVGCLTLLGVLFILGLIGSVVGDNNSPSSSPSKKSTPQVDNSWVPEGFTRYDNKVATRWTPNYEVSCQRGTRCSQLEVVPKIGCDYLYARVSLIDSTGNNIGFTNDSTRNVKAGQKALMMLSTYKDAAEQFSSPEITCR